MVKKSENFTILRFEGKGVAGEPGESLGWRLAKTEVA